MNNISFNLLSFKKQLNRSYYTDLFFPLYLFNKKNPWIWNGYDFECLSIRLCKIKTTITKIVFILQGGKKTKQGECYKTYDVIYVI